MLLRKKDLKQEVHNNERNSAAHTNLVVENCSLKNEVERNKRAQNVMKTYGAHSLVKLASVDANLGVGTPRKEAGNEQEVRRNESVETGRVCGRAGANTDSDFLQDKVVLF